MIGVMENCVVYKVSRFWSLQSATNTTDEEAAVCFHMVVFVMIIQVLLSYTSYP